MWTMAAYHINEGYFVVMVGLSNYSKRPRFEESVNKKSS